MSSYPYIWTEQAENVVRSTYGDRVSVLAKAKDLSKFGRTSTNVGTTFVTVSEFQDAVTDETFVATNIIDAIVSTAAADMGKTFTIEGHTIDGSGNLTFVVQNATLDGSDGRTEAALSTPLARANRIYLTASGTFNSPQAAPAGNIAVYDNTDGITAGKPDTDAAVKLILLAGDTQSNKAATSISASDYWFVTYFDGFVSDAGGNANRVSFQLQTRDVFNGGAWRPLGGDIVVFVGSTGIPPTPLKPFLIVPKNHDVRVVAKADSNTAAVSAEFGGVLAAVL
jgi:hypothetical protein